MAQSRLLQFPGFDVLLEGACSVLEGALSPGGGAPAGPEPRTQNAAAGSGDAGIVAGMFIAQGYGGHNISAADNGDHGIFSSIMLASCQMAMKSPMTDAGSSPAAHLCLPSTPPSIGSPFTQLSLGTGGSPLGPLPMSPIQTSSADDCTIPILSSPTRAFCTTTASGLYSNSSSMLWSPGAGPLSPLAPGAVALTPGKGMLASPATAGPPSSSPMFSSPLCCPLTTLATLSTLSDVELMAVMSPRGQPDFSLSRGKRRASPLATSQPRPSPRRMELLRLASGDDAPSAPTPSVLVAVPAVPPPGIAQLPATAAAGATAATAMACATAATATALPTLRPAGTSTAPAASNFLHDQPADSHTQVQLERRGSSDSSSLTTDSCAAEASHAHSQGRSPISAPSQPSQAPTNGGNGSGSGSGSARYVSLVLGGTSGPAGSSHVQQAVAGGASARDEKGRDRVVLQPFTFGSCAPSQQKDTTTVNMWIRAIATKHGDGSRR